MNPNGKGDKEEIQLERVTLWVRILPEGLAQDKAVSPLSSVSLS